MISGSKGKIETSSIKKKYVQYLMEMLFENQTRYQRTKDRNENSYAEILKFYRRTYIQ